MVQLAWLRVVPYVDQRADPSVVVVGGGDGVAVAAAAVDGMPLCEAIDPSMDFQTDLA